MDAWKHLLKRYWEKGSSLRETLSELFSFSNSEVASGQLHDAIFSRIKQLLTEPDGSIPARKLQILHDFLAKVRSETEIREEQQKLFLLIPRSIEEDAVPLLALTLEQRKHVLNFLLGIALETKAGEPQLEELARFAQLLGVSEDDYSHLEQEATTVSNTNQSQALRSGTGLLVALCVLIVFILTATLLRSLVFGLILAYLLLPLEKFFERKLQSRRGVIYWSFYLLSIPLNFLKGISERVMRRSADPGVPEAPENRRRRHVIRKATGITFTLFLLFVGVFLFFAVSLTGHYVSQFDPKTKMVALSAKDAPPSPATGALPTQVTAGTQGPLTIQIQEFIDQQKLRFADQPLICKSLVHMEKLLHNKTMQMALVEDVLKRSGGVFSITTGVLGQVGALLSDVLLTIFFAVFFLQKMAEYCRNDKSTGTIGSYLVSIVFNGKWLPNPGQEALQDGQRLIAGVLSRLQVWVKGYLTLVCIDTTVYCIVFYFLGVPYFPILAFLAGCGILLPYVGPILSCGVTCFVTLAAGNGTGMQLCEIAIAYVIYNGIVEQFLLYPAVIGEALGLTTLETIVFVILGAIFAGITGMIFALPTASVIKYLVPQIYRIIGKKA